MDIGGAAIWALGVVLIFVLGIYAKHRWNSWRERRREQRDAKDKQKATSTTA